MVIGYTHLFESRLLSVTIIKAIFCDIIMT